MADMVKPTPQEIAEAFRKAAKELGCDKSEQQFQEALFAIGTQKISNEPKPASKRTSKLARRPTTK
jgi:hypothetical protein